MIISNIIAIIDPKHLTRCSRHYGIPTTFWIAQKKAFSAGVAPTLIYKDDNYKCLVPVKICENPEHPYQNNDDMLFKLVRRTVSKLKDELLKIWEGAKISHHNLYLHFPSVKDMTAEQSTRLRILNAKLAVFEKQLRRQFDWVEATYPGHCHWANIHFHLAESDPDYSDNDDNFIITIKEIVAASELDDVNWNTDPRLIDENGELEYQCYLYHELYEHSGLLWEDLLRIEKIWVQFRVNFDLDIDLSAENAELTGLMDC